MSSGNLNALLNRYIDNNVRVKKSSKREALSEWEKPVKRIIDNVARRDNRFQIQEVLPGGSFYERLKVKEADEFDIMLVIKGIELGYGQPYKPYTPWLPPPPIRKTGGLQCSLHG